MRLALPITIFGIVGGLYWLVRHDIWGAMSALPWSAREDAVIVIGVVFWLSTAWLVSAVLATIILSGVHRRGAQNKLPKLLTDVSAIVVYAVAGVVILSQVLDLPLNGVLATSGVLAAVIGLAVQKTIADVMAGIALNVEQGFKLGDWIEMPSGATGEVSEITWRTTRLVTIEGRMIVVPNSILIGNHFTNLNAPERCFRVRKTISLDYSVPTERAISALQAAIEATAGVLKAPRSMVLIEECGDSGIHYSLNFWVPDYPASLTISRDVIANALRFLDQTGIVPVSSKLDVTIHGAGERRIERHVDPALLLRRTSFFRSFGEEALRLLAAAAELHEFPAGQVVVEEGEAGASLFIVVTGLLDVSKRSDAADARMVGRLLPGEVFGEMSLLTGAPRSTTVTAATETMLLEISKQHLEPILTEHPEVIAELSRLQADRLATNESVLALWPDERQDIVRLGMSAFLRNKIGRFFGRVEI